MNTITRDAVQSASDDLTAALADGVSDAAALALVSRSRDMLTQVVERLQLEERAGQLDGVLDTSTKAAAAAKSSASSDAGAKSSAQVTP